MVSKEIYLLLKLGFNYLVFWKFHEPSYKVFWSPLMLMWVFQETAQVIIWYTSFINFFHFILEIFRAEVPNKITVTEIRMHESIYYCFFFFITHKRWQSGYCIYLIAGFLANIGNVVFKVQFIISVSKLESNLELNNPKLTFISLESYFVYFKMVKASHDLLG